MNREFALSPTIPALILFVFGMITFMTGCQDKKASATNPEVTDVTSPAPAYASASSPAPGYQPAPQPVTYDTMPTSSNGNTGGGYGNSYTVKKGDTLYAIARAKYGDGKQWQRIAQANPGVSPSSLKVGQTITLP